MPAPTSGLRREAERPLVIDEPISAFHPVRTFGGGASKVCKGSRLYENANALRNRRTILSATARRAHWTAPRCLGLPFPALPTNPARRYVYRPHVFTHPRSGIRLLPRSIDQSSIGRPGQIKPSCCIKRTSRQADPENPIATIVDRRNRPHLRRVGDFRVGWIRLADSSSQPPARLRGEPRRPGRCRRRAEVRACAPQPSPSPSRCCRRPTARCPERSPTRSEPGP